jgi:hypothetical protein
MQKTRTAEVLLLITVALYLSDTYDKVAFLTKPLAFYQKK